jgi:predicted RNA-binding protein YlxR (DUF448 family)
MVRVVRRPDGTLSVGTGLPGRGAWLCRDDAGCLELAIRRKAFERALHGPVDDSQVEAVRSAIQPGVESGSEGRAL